VSFRTATSALPRLPFHNIVRDSGSPVAVCRSPKSLPYSCLLVFAKLVQVSPNDALFCHRLGIFIPPLPAQSLFLVGGRPLRWSCAEFRLGGFFPLCPVFCGDLRPTQERGGPFLFPASFSLGPPHAPFCRAERLPGSPGLFLSTAPRFSRPAFDSRRAVAEAIST